MARGGKRAQRAKKSGGFSGGGGGGNGLAQSGGKSTTFQGGSGGGTWTNKGGSAGQGVKGHGVTNSGTPYKVRPPGGDNASVHLVGKVRTPPALRAGSGVPIPPKVVVKPSGAARQAGGSTQ